MSGRSSTTWPPLTRFSGRLRKGADRHVNRYFLATLFVVGTIAAACGDSPPSPPALVPSPTAKVSASTVPGLIQPPEITVGPGFAPEACNQARLFGGQTSPDSQGGVNEVWSESMTGGAPSRMVHISLPDSQPSVPVPQKSPPTISPLRAAGDWVVFTEYQQHSNTLSLSYWKVAVLHLTDLRITIVASSSQTSLRDLPDPSISSDGIVVWDEDSAAGRVLRTRDMNTDVVKTLSLPVGTLPILPRIDGSTVVFADNQTDPNRANENWVSWGGHLMAYDLTTGVTRKLDSTNDARRIEFTNGRVLWNAALPDANGKPSDTWQMRLSQLDGGPSTTLGMGDLGLISDSDALWYDYQAGFSYVHSFSNGNTYKLAIAGLSRQQSLPTPIYTLCGTAVYYMVDSPRQLRMVAVP